MPANLPSILFASSCNILPVETIDKVLNGNLPEPVKVDENITAYKWKIDNKYYYASVNLCAIARKELSTDSFSNLVEAIVIYFDSEDLRGLELAESWLPFLDVYDPEIKILVCKNCAEDGEEVGEKISKITVQEWCIQRGFELVEIEPSVDDIDPDDDFLETTGVERIRQALNAHRWPNLVLKSDSVPNPIHAADISDSDDVFEDRLLDNDNLEEEDFASLFSQFSEIKAQLSTLSGDARKEAAEKVVRDFWQAMGGDGEDLDEL